MLGKYSFSLFLFLLLLSSLLLVPNKVQAASTHVTASSYDIPYQAYKDITFTISNPLNEDFKELNVSSDGLGYSGEGSNNPISCSGSTCTTTLRTYGNNYGSGPVYYAIFDSNNNLLYAEDDSNQFAILDLTVPQVSSISGPTEPVFINTNQNFSATFTDVSGSGPHTVEWNWGDGSYSYGTVTEADGSGTVTASHTYTVANHNPYGVILTVWDKDKVLNFSELSVVATSRSISSLSGIDVYVNRSNKNKGLKLDLRAELYRDSTLIASGELNTVNVSPAASVKTIPFNTSGTIAFPANSNLSVKVYARNACSGSTALTGTTTLSFNSSNKDSKFAATIDSTATYYLLDSNLLGTSAGNSLSTLSLTLGVPCSAYQQFGTWSIVP